MDYHVSELNSSNFESVIDFCKYIITDFYGIEPLKSTFSDLQINRGGLNVYTNSTKGKMLLVLDEDDIIIGSGGISALNNTTELIDQLGNKLENKDYTAKLSRVYVKKEFRGKRIASEIFELLKKDALAYGYTHLYLNASEKPNVVSFWKKFGFSTIHVENDQYKTNHMLKTIL